MPSYHQRTAVRRLLPVFVISVAAAACGGAPDDGASTEGTESTSSALIAERKVCWSPLQVRDDPANRSIGQTYRGRTFHVDRYSPSGEWAYGYAESCNGNYVRGWTQVAGLAAVSTGKCHDGSTPTFIGCF